MSFFATSKSKDSKKHLSKKGIGLGINILAVSVLQPHSSPTAPSRTKHHSATTSTTSTKTTKTRARSSTTTAGPAVSNEKSTNKKSEMSDDGLPVLTALRTKPPYYEDLHTLTAYGELPLPSFPTVTSPRSEDCHGTSSPILSPTSPTMRLFEVAKPPAAAKRRRYTVATSRPSLKEKENQVTENDDKSVVSNGLSEMKEEDGLLGEDETLKTPTALPTLRPPTTRASSVPCDLPSPSLSPTSPSMSSPVTPEFSGEKTSSEPDNLATTSKAATTPTPRRLNVNMRFIKHYPYIVPELPNSPVGEDESRKDGVLSRVKYRLMKYE